MCSVGYCALPTQESFTGSEFSQEHATMSHYNQQNSRVNSTISVGDYVMVLNSPLIGVFINQKLSKPKFGIMIKLLS